MVKYEVGYGILLTDEFGSHIYDDILDLILNEVEDEYSCRWLVCCPSAEDNQFILGLSVKLDKKLDFKKLDKQWLALMATLPLQAKEWFNSYELPEQNLHVMAGKY